MNFIYFQMFFCNNESDETYNLHIIKSSENKRRKLTKKRAEAMRKIGEIYPSEGSSVFQLPGTLQICFTGNTGLDLQF